VSGDETADVDVDVTVEGAAGRAGAPYGYLIGGPKADDCMGEYCTAV